MHSFAEVYLNVYTSVNMKVTIICELVKHRQMPTWKMNNRIIHEKDLTHFPYWLKQNSN